MNPSRRGFLGAVLGLGAAAAMLGPVGAVKALGGFVRNRPDYRFYAEPVIIPAGAQAYPASIYPRIIAAKIAHARKRMEEKLARDLYACTDAQVTETEWVDFVDKTHRRLKIKYLLWERGY